MSEQRIDDAAQQAAQQSADVGEGQGLASPALHAGGTVPGGGPETADAPLSKDFQEGEGAEATAAPATAATEGGQVLQEQADVARRSMDPD